MALVMFDYDGVIVDSLGQFTNDFITSCLENGFDRLTSQDDALALFEHNVYEAMQEYGLAPGTIENILKTYETKARNHLDDVKLFNGIGEVLQKVSETNLIYIVTSNISSVPETVLKNHGISCVREVVGAEKEKSKIKKIRNLMEMFRDLPAFYVGDTKGDILEGRAAGARTVGVAWGWHGAARLKESSPDFLVHSPEELAELFCK